MNHVIRSPDVMDQEFCGALCFMEHNSVSYNYITTSETVKQKCELNNATYEEHEEDLRTGTFKLCLQWSIGKQCPFSFQCLFFFFAPFSFTFFLFFFCTLEQAPALVSIISISFFSFRLRILVEVARALAEWSVKPVLHPRDIVACALQDLRVRIVKLVGTRRYVLILLTKCFIATADLETQVLKLLKDPNDRRVCFNSWQQFTCASVSFHYVSYSICGITNVVSLYSVNHSFDMFCKLENSNCLTWSLIKDSLHFAVVNSIHFTL